jgi:hypothetical protein
MFTTSMCVTTSRLTWIYHSQRMNFNIAFTFYLLIGLNLFISDFHPHSHRFKAIELGLFQIRICRWTLILWKLSDLRVGGEHSSWIFLQHSAANSIYFTSCKRFKESSSLPYCYKNILSRYYNFIFSCIFDLCY